jgi:hypothetical protein
MTALWDRFKATGQAPTAVEKVAGITDLEELEAFRLSTLGRDAMTDDLHEAIRLRERELRA